MYKGIEWLKEAIGELDLVDTVFDVGGVSYIDTAVRVMQVYDLIAQLDEPEVLSQEWIDKNKFEVKGWNEAVHVEDLQNLLVPKQEELESKIKVLIEAYKQEDGAYSNPENGWIGGFVEDLENLVEEEPLYRALIKGYELLNIDGIYWTYNKNNGDVLFSNLHSPDDNFSTEMSKLEWNKLGINDANADFIKVDE